MAHQKIHGRLEIPTDGDPAMDVGSRLRGSTARTNG